MLTAWVEIIRIHHECEARIEKSVPRIAVWHHEACRVMANGDSKRRFSYPILTQMMDSFSCSPLFFILKISEYTKMQFDIMSSL